MKNILSKINLHVQGISPRTLQLASLAFALVIMLIQQSPEDGPGGIR
ncbi:MAG: hypothetical protein ACM3QS_12030 [Bacteroidota bacterium]